jgi:hypothetical protein
MRVSRQGLEVDPKLIDNEQEGRRNHLEDSGLRLCLGPLRVGSRTPTAPMTRTVLLGLAATNLSKIVSRDYRGIKHMQTHEREHDGLRTDS